MLFALYIGQQLLSSTGRVLDFWMQVMKFQHTVLPVVTSLSGIAFFYGFARIVSASTASAPLAFIGRKGLPMAMHHLFAFFLVNVVLCVTGYIRPVDISNRYFQWRTERLWWLYIVAGIAIPKVIGRYIAGPISRWSATLFPRVRARTRPAA